MNKRDGKITIGIVIPTLDKGGAERVLVHFVNNLDHSQYHAVIFCLKKQGDLLSSIDPQVAVVDVDCPRVYFSVPKIKNLVKKYNVSVLIGWMGHVNAVLAFFRPILPAKLTLICRESSIPSKYISHYRLPGLFRLMYRSMNRYDGIICQSEAMKQDLIQQFKVKRGKIVVINNPVVPPALDSEVDPAAASFIRAGTRLLLFVGRFSAEKQAHLLVETMQLLPAEYRLILVGYGPLEQQIRKKIEDTGASDRIMIITDCKNPTPYYKKADCLILTSSFEGFPNVLLEANLQGCPVIVYKTEGGAKEIIHPGSGVYIEPSSTGGLEQLAVTIKEVCTSGRYDSEKIAARVRDQYEIKRTVNAYLQFITNTIKTKTLPADR